jgi:uncharacterized membrane protein
MRKNVEDWERVISISAGAALLATAVWKRANRSAGLTGVGLIARGVSGVCPVNAALGRTRRRDDPRRALSGSRGLRLDQTITIARPVEEVYAFWRDLRNLPRFLRHLDRINVLDDERSHWVLRGPGGIRLEWDAEIINLIPFELIGWKSLPGADVASAGSVRFRALDADSTEVHVLLQYDPPAGKLGASLAWLAGQAPSTMLHDDLYRMKELLETGTWGQTTDDDADKFSWLIVES